jgi:hypothetical protein
LKKKRGRKPKNQKTVNDFLEEEYTFNSDNESPETQEPQDIIDDTNSKGIRVMKKNTVRCDSLGSLVHVIALTTINLSSSKRWYVKINKPTLWLGLGVCSRNIVSHPAWRFNTSKNGCILFSTNGYSWNSNNNSENNCKLKDMPAIEPGDLISFFYDAKKLKLDIRFKDYSITLTNVYSESGILGPCAVFINWGDEISFLKFENI